MDKEKSILLFEKYISGVATPDEIEQLLHSIRNDANISTWLEQQFMHSDTKMDADVSKSLLENIYKEAHINSTKPHFAIRTLLRYAAAILIPLLCIFTTYYVTKPTVQDSPFIVSVNKGQRSSLSLPDGSRVWINAQSQLSYTTSYNQKERRLKLEGQAYFEVAKDPKRPFVVECNGIDVEALGTEFSIKSYESEMLFTTVLMGGKTKVTTPDKEYILLPSNELTYNRETHTAKMSKVANAFNSTSWIRDELRFENESLQEIAVVIRRLYDVDIQFVDNSIKDQRFTGTIVDRGLKSIFDIISITSPISYKIEEDKVLLYESTKESVYYNIQ